MIRFRRALSRDAETMSTILIASITQLCAADHRNDPALIASWTANKSPAALVRMIEEATVTFFIAERNGEPAGVGGIDCDGIVRLNYVSPEHRFKGVSSALLTFMEAELAKAGVTEARLVSSETARELYRKAGWTDDGDPVHPMRVAGYPMRKRLAKTPFEIS